jgi:hypothetical protein
MVRVLNHFVDVKFRCMEKILLVSVAQERTQFLPGTVPEIGRSLVIPDALPEFSSIPEFQPPSSILFSKHY